MTSFLNQTKHVFEAIHFNQPMVAECYGETIKFFCYYDRATDWPTVIKWHQSRHPRPVFCFMDVREISHLANFDLNNSNCHVTWIPHMWADHGVDPKHMLWIGNYHSTIDHDDVVKSLGMDINTQWIRYFEGDAFFKHYVQQSDKNKQGPFHMTPRHLMTYDKKYLALFGKPRKFMRAGAMILMHRNGMDHDAIISSLAEQQGIQQAVEWTSQYWDKQELETVFNKHAGAVDHIVYDSPQTMDSNYRGYPYDVDLYRNTAISIVAETNDVASDNHPLGQFWVTEKICRTMFNHHPFVVLSTPHFLKNLKQLGYQTFDSIIDESYDECTDPYTRLAKAIGSARDLADNITSTLLKDIVVHNFQMLHKVFYDITETLNTTLNHISSIK